MLEDSISRVKMLSVKAVPIPPWGGEPSRPALCSPHEVGHVPGVELPAYTLHAHFKRGCISKFCSAPY
eukprot:9028859-Pyramimonas_sp.AAC.1